MVSDFVFFWCFGCNGHRGKGKGFIVDKGAYTTVKLRLYGLIQLSNVRLIVPKNVLALHWVVADCGLCCDISLYFVKDLTFFKILSFIRRFLDSIWRYCTRSVVLGSIGSYRISSEVLVPFGDIGFLWNFGVHSEVSRFYRKMIGLVKRF